MRSPLCCGCESVQRRLFGEPLSPDWYVFPSAEGKSKPDPTKPMSGWRSAWRKNHQGNLLSRLRQVQDPTDVCCNEDCKADISQG